LEYFGSGIKILQKTRKDKISPRCLKAPSISFSRRRRDHSPAPQQKLAIRVPQRG
jgi:hypothetical protein